jgi:hypothetical protein
MTNFLRGCRLLWLAVTTGWLIAATTALAGESIWNHNGSIMRWVGVGPERWVSYLDPRLGLRAVGVQPGTLLFRGRRIGNWMEGTAYTFSAGCAPAAYWVEGSIYSDTDVTLQGPTPIQDPYSCAVIGYSWYSPNTVLRFVYMGRPYGME